MWNQSEMTFHTRCGSNIVLSEDRTSAEKREHGFANYLNTSVFSSHSLDDSGFTVHIHEGSGVREYLILLFLKKFDNNSHPFNPFIQ